MILKIHSRLYFIIIEKQFQLLKKCKKSHFFVLFIDKTGAMMYSEPRQVVLKTTCRKMSKNRHACSFLQICEVRQVRQTEI